MPTAIDRATQVLRLAIADLRRDWALAVCQVFAVAAVLTPLLVLFGLQQGVLGRLLDDLRENPAMREIVPRVTGANRFDAAWIEAARRRPDVAFAAGSARFTASEVELAVPARPGHEPVLARLEPTGPGDPLVPEAAWLPVSGLEPAVLSFGAARALGVGPGDAAEIVVPRSRDGFDESQRLAILVAAVLPPDRIDETRRALFVSETLVLDIQHFRDGFGVPRRDWPGPQPPAETRFERFRLYAATIEDVAPLTAWLRAQGVEPVSRLADIAPIQALNRNLGTILLVITVFAAAGFIVALAATQWSGVERKRRELALLSLIGYGPGWLVAVPLVQAVLLGLLGSAVAMLLFGAAAGVINAYFPTVGAVATAACRLFPGQLALATLATCLLAVAAVVLAAVQIARIEPAGLIRDV